MSIKTLFKSLCPPPLWELLRVAVMWRDWLLFSWRSGSPTIPWAFIRVSNERETLKQSLESILGAVKRGVIVYHECTDGSAEIIQEFCKKNPTFKAYEYPHHIAQCHTTQKEMQESKTLADYYNFALSLIPKNEWLVKIDTDQIYDSKKLKESFSLVKDVGDVVFYFRMNLHIFEGRVYIDKNQPLSDCMDHWLICNRRLKFINQIVTQEQEDVFYWELLQIPFVYDQHHAILNTWHFPCLKASRKENAKIENYVPIAKAKEVIPQHYFTQGRITEDMLDEKRILKALQPNL